jgi:hypothetical protein
MILVENDNDNSLDEQDDHLLDQMIEFT